jgi:hypothetical protein
VTAAAVSSEHSVDVARERWRGVLHEQGCEENTEEH